MNKQWETFKNTWKHIVEKNQSDLFYAFDFYITSEIWKDNNYVNNIETIWVINKNMDKITLKNKTLYVYESPFYVLIDNKTYPSGLLMENIITFLIKSIVNKSSSTINVVKDSRRHIEEEREEEEEDEETEEKAEAIVPN